jgi:hypothetical protein
MWSKTVCLVLVLKELRPSVWQCGRFPHSHYHAAFICATQKPGLRVIPWPVNGHNLVFSLCDNQSSSTNKDENVSSET